MSAKYRAVEVCVPVTVKQMKYVRAASGAELTGDQRNSILTMCSCRCCCWLCVPSNAESWRLNSGPKKMARRSAVYSNSLDHAYHTTDAVPHISEQIDQEWYSAIVHTNI